MRSKFLYWFFAFAAIATTVVFVVLIGSAFLDKHLSFWAKLLFLIACVTVALAVFLAGERIIDPAQGIKSLRKPKMLALTILGTTTVFGVMTDIFGLLSPRTAVESEVGIIERTGEDTNQRVARIEDRLADALPDMEAILPELNGVWGERGCADYLYRIRTDLETSSITLTQLRPDTEYRARGLVRGLDKGDIISEIREPAEERGQTTRYSLRGDGGLQTLTIIMGAEQSGTELDRCQEPTQRDTP